eukprot:5882133-Amphidinium_carterae.2
MSASLRHSVLGHVLSICCFLELVAAVKHCSKHEVVRWVFLTGFSDEVTGLALCVSVAHVASRGVRQILHGVWGRSSVDSHLIAKHLQQTGPCYGFNSLLVAQHTRGQTGMLAVARESQFDSECRRC